MLETCCDILRDAYSRRWISTRDGNISVRHHDRDHFYITPSGVRKQQIQPEMFRKALFFQEGYLIEETKGLGANLKPSGEMPLHFGLQKNIADADTRVVVHLHPTYTIAAMHAGINLPDLLKDFPELSRYTKVAPNVPMVPPISQELADACHKNLGLDTKGYTQFDIVGITGHGVVSLGSTPWRAYEHIERLEHICQIVLASGKHLQVQAQPQPAQEEKSFFQTVVDEAKEKIDEIKEKFN